MKNEVLAHLHDTVQAGKALKTFVAGRTFEHYTSDEPAVLEHIRDHRDVISFRNILIHGYDAIDDRIVWGVIEDDLDNLIEDAEALLDEDQDRTAASNATSG